VQAAKATLQSRAFSQSVYFKLIDRYEQGLIFDGVSQNGGDYLPSNGLQIGRGGATLANQNPPKVFLAANPALLNSWAHANSATKLVEVYWQ